MSDKKDKNTKNFQIPRPTFPKRAVVTGGMPYGNKELHFGHVGGMLVFADTFDLVMMREDESGDFTAADLKGLSDFLLSARE